MTIKYTKHALSSEFWDQFYHPSSSIAIKILEEFKIKCRERNGSKAVTAIKGYICLLGTFSVMIALIHVLYKRLDIKEHFSAAIYVLSSFLDDGIKIPTKMAKSTAFKLCISGWLLTVVILLNCYNALVTTSLSSSSYGTKLESQKQIACGEDQKNRSIEKVRRSIHNLFWFWYE